MAGGGTGGHLFPAIAIAKVLVKKNQKNRILFVSSGRAFEKAALKREGFAHVTIPIEGIKGRGWITQAVAASKIPLAMLKSTGILLQFKPHMVIGMGGYSAGPVVAAAKLMGIKTAICEQNLFPGVTNRILMKFVDRIYVGFENTKGTRGLKKVRVLGNPVREEIAAVSKQDHDHKAAPVTDGFNVLIVGGSQGAHAINMAMIDAILRFEKKARIHFVHQTGPKDEAVVVAAYKKAGVSCDVKPFFYDMVSLYQMADLVVCRAGATTVAEICAIGKTALFIPFPHAADNHQVLNAGAMVDTGAAEMIQEKDLSGKVIAERITHYMKHPDLIQQMAENAGKLGKPDAAEKIADDCLRQIEERHVS